MDMEKFKERMEKYNNGTTMPNLTMQVKSKMWLTPSATNITERSEEGLKKREKMRNKSGRKTVPPGSLAEQVKYGYPITDMREAKMWPTPRATERMAYHESPSPSMIKGTHGWNLNAAVTDAESENPNRMWPTPTARDYKGGRKPETLEAKGRKPSNSLPDTLNSLNKTTGALNPEWVEWLMGYPIGWTDLNH
jgi:hypothetical protein